MAGILMSYDPEILYNLGKANAVADALFRNMEKNANFEVKPSLVEGIAYFQEEDPILAQIKKDVEEVTISSFQIDSRGILRMNGRICVPDVNGIR